MKNLLRLEELALFGFSIVLFNITDFAWWWYPALLLTPDIGMIGYIVNTQFGAFSYNLFHHKGLALLVMGLGWYLGMDSIYLAGIILLGHASMDRIFGYGLKYGDSFHHTHLGWMKPPPVR